MTQEEQVLIELLNCNAISENTGLTASEVSELVTHNKASARLSSLRQKGYVKSSNNSRPISVYWLSKEGIELASELKTKQDQSADANLSTANNASENKDLTDDIIINEVTSQANSDDNGFKYPIYKKSVMSGAVIKFTGLTFGEVVEATERSNSKGFTSDFLAHVDKRWWLDWTPPETEATESTKIDPVIVENVEALQKAQAELAETKRASQYEMDERLFMDDLPSGSREIPPPQYNPYDVAFKKSDTVFWYTVDGIKEVFETSSDAIHAAHDYVATHGLSTIVHAVASKPHAIIKPVVTTELEYL